jgi:hypothetical protein
MIKNVGSRALMALLYGAGFSAACSGGGAVNIGNTNAVGSQLSDYAASWDGYAEAYTFTPDGSDRVRLTIAANGQGTLQVGNMALIPPATDPNVGYPPGESKDQGYGPTTDLSEGVLFPIYDAQIQTNRIQVGIKPNDLYSAWCALQTPTTTYSKLELADGGGQYDTVVVDGGPNLPTDAGVTTVYSACPFLVASSGIPPNVMCYGEVPIGQPPVLVDCGYGDLCNEMVCACTATSCTSAPLVAAGSAPSQYPVELDAALDSTGTMLTGTLALSTDLRVTVVLTKQ